MENRFPLAMTVQIRVTDIKTGAPFYERLFGRPADLVSTPTFHEWELLPNSWFQVAEGRPTVGNGPIRFGVADVVAERGRLMAALHVEIEPIERIAGLVAWCTFSDPWGNRVGLFQDLALHPDA